jgi:hypothetical protein
MTQKLARLTQYEEGLEKTKAYNADVDNKKMKAVEVECIATLLQRDPFLRYIGMKLLNMKREEYCKTLVYPFLFFTVQSCLN